MTDATPRPVLYIIGLCFAALAFVVVWRGCPGPTAPTAPEARPTTSETRATEASSRAEAATRALLGRASAASLSADSLYWLLSTERLRTEGLRDDLAEARAATDRAAATRTPGGKVAADTTRGTAPTPGTAGLQDLLVTERRAADAALTQCEAREDLSGQLAEAQRERSVWAYAAADSALAARASMLLAYREADARASSLALRLDVASSRTEALTRQRNLFGGVALGLVAGCTILALAR